MQKVQLIVKGKEYTLELRSLVGTNYRKETLKEISGNESDLAYAYAALYNDYYGKLDFTFEDLMFTITDEKALEISRFLKERLSEIGKLYVTPEVEAEEQAAP